MNIPAPWKKPLFFGLFGAIGCLAGWLIGEPLLAMALPSGSTGGRAPSLIARAQPPAAEAPPLPAEFRNRAALANAKTGDLQFSLIWDNANDLDLMCLDPNGYRIFFNQRRSPSGGELDVDRHADCTDADPNPAENIYWAANTAPPGHYTVQVHYYARCGSAPLETPYKATVLIGTERIPIEGTIGQLKGTQTIHEFDLSPQLAVFVAPEADLSPNTTVKLPVAIQRTYIQGPVQVELVDPPTGISADPITIPANADTGELELEIASGAPLASSRAARVRVSSGGVVGQGTISLTVLPPGSGDGPSFSPWLILVIGLWTALLASGLALLLMMGQNRYLNRPLFSGGQWLKVAGGSALAGFVSGALGQTLFFLLFAAGLQKLGFLVGWILLGALVSRGVSMFIPNLAWKKAMLAGIVGGFFGGAAFLVASQVVEGAGRFIGAAILGFCIGLMMAIAEAAFRRAWLEVSHGPREISMVTLGPEPVAVGGDSRRCAIWVNGAADVALRFWVRGNQVICGDVQAHQENAVPAGHFRKVGKVEITVRTAMEAPPEAQAPQPLIPRSQPSASSSSSSLPASSSSQMRRSAPPPLPSSISTKPSEPEIHAPETARETPAPATTPHRGFGKEIQAPGANPRYGGEIFAPPTTPKAEKEVHAPDTKPRFVSPPPPPASLPISPPPPPPPPASPPPKSPDACPICGRVVPGKPGTRYCMIHDDVPF